MRKIGIVFLLICLLSTDTAAANWDSEAMDRLHDALPEAANYLQNDGTADGFLDDLGLIWDTTVRQSRGYLRTAGSSMLRVLCVMILCQLIKEMIGEHSNRTAALLGALGITAAAASDVKMLLGLGIQVMDEIHTFSDSLLPVLASAAAASGSLSGAGIRYTVTVFFGDILIRLSREVLLPLICAYVAMAAADAALVDGKMKKLRELLGWMISGGLKLLLGAFTAFLTVTGVLTGASDALALKTAKLTFSTMIPVVGSILSDASESLLAGAGMVRTAAGTLGMTAILAVFALPCVKITVSWLLFRITGALGGIFDSSQSNLLDAISTAMGYILAMVSSCVFMSLLSCCCFMKAVHG